MFSVVTMKENLVVSIWINNTVEHVLVNACLSSKNTLVWFIPLCICMWTITVTIYLCYYCYVSVHTRINNKMITFLSCADYCF
jgi:hypothetical protein